MEDINRINDIIDGVLSGDEFQPAAKADTSFFKDIYEYIMNIIEKVVEWFVDVFGSLLEKLINLVAPNWSLSGASSTVKGIIALVGMVIVIALVVVIVIVIIKLVKSKERTQQSRTFAQELVSFTENTSRPYELSKKYYQESDYRMAYRYLFIALLINLNTKGLININIAKTNRKYREEIRESSADMYEEILPFFESFDLYWYGGRELSQADVDAWYQKYDALGVTKE